MQRLPRLPKLRNVCTVIRTNKLISVLSGTFAIPVKLILLLSGTFAIPVISPYAGLTAAVGQLCGRVIDLVGVGLERSP